MTELYQESSCKECGGKLNELPSTPLEERKPCHICGSLNKSLYIHISETIEVHTLMKLSHREPGRKKPKVEMVSGQDLHRDSGVWMNLERIIDRGKNWYKEHITNPHTGEVVHYVEHPLDQHIGHGSAKHKKEL